MRELSIVIVYDNLAYDNRLEPGFGFSCLVKLPERSILFDTGGDSSTLLYNMEQLGIKPQDVSTVVLSHAHGDHAGGLAGFLKKNGNVSVYVLASFPRGLKEGVKLYGARLEEVWEPGELLNNVFSTGELNIGAREQSLIVKTRNGAVVITGCAHPGVVNIVQKAKELIGDRVYLVLGGFHLGGEPAPEIESIIYSFKRLGVEKVMPCHCSGAKAQTLFREHYNKDYIECGVGAKVTLEV